MYIDNQGINIHKYELRVLLKFAESAKDSHLAIVHFESDGIHVYGRSTDGHRAVQAKGLANHEDAAKGDWTVNTAYLKDCYKLLTADDMLVLKVSGASLHSAGIVDTKTLEERSCVESTHDAAQVQTTFPLEPLVRLIQLPTTSKRPRCATVMGSWLSNLDLLADAASEGIDIYFGKTSQEGIYFAAEGQDTDWLGRIMGMKRESEETPETDGETNRQGELTMLPMDDEGDVS